MFASQVAQYNTESVLGGPSGARDRFDPAHPFYRALAELVHMRQSTPALWGGATLVRARSGEAGLFAVSRFDPADGAEVLAVFNTSSAPITAQVEVEVVSTRFKTLTGACPAQSSAPGSVRITLPAFGYAICAANHPATKDPRP